MTYLTTLAFLALLGTSVAPATAQSGSGTTTRYWDCCKPSCAWPVSGITTPVKSCDISDKPLTDTNAQSGCAGGTAYMCSDQSPWEISADLAYGFAAVGASSPNCCSCYQLTFTSSVIKGKKMIVQATNTGNDVSTTQFDLAIPGGGFGQFDGCTTEWKATSDVWGARYGGPSSNTCSSFPSALQPGCGFRWGWMQGADNPTVDWEVVTCPAELVAKSGCSVSGYHSASGPSSPASSPAVSAQSPSVAAPSPPTSVASTPSSGLPVEKPSASSEAAAPATTQSPITVPSSSPAVQKNASQPFEAGKAAPVHPHWIPHKHQASSKEENGNTESTGDEDQSSGSDCDA